MNRAVLLTLIVILMLLGMATLRGDVIALALPLLVALGFGFVDMPQELAVRMTRRVAPERATQGEPVVVQITLVNDGAHLHMVMLRDMVPRGLEVIDGASQLVTSLAPGAATELRYTVRGNRGMYTFGALQINACDRLGLFERSARLDAPGRLFVLPEVLRLRQVTVRPRRTRVYSGIIPARQGGAGIEFFGVRSYQPGDPLRRINPRASARQIETLFVNEFEQERVADVGIILDAREKSDVRGPDSSLFEYSVQAATALADGLLAQGNRVGLLVYGNSIEWTYPGYGKVQREKLMRALASARAGDRIALETLDAIPTRLFPTRSLLILISPLVAEDMSVLVGLRGRGYQLLVLSPDAVAYEQSILENAPDLAFGVRLASIERLLMLRRMQQAGVRVVNWPVTTPFPQVAAQALARRGI